MARKSHDQQGRTCNNQIQSPLFVYSIQRSILGPRYILVGDRQTLKSLLKITCNSIPMIAPEY